HASPTRRSPVLPRRRALRRTGRQQQRQAFGAPARHQCSTAAWPLTFLPRAFSAGRGGNAALAAVFPAFLADLAGRWVPTRSPQAGRKAPARSGLAPRKVAACPRKVGSTLALASPISSAASSWLWPSMASV